MEGIKSDEEDNQTNKLDSVYEQTNTLDRPKSANLTGARLPRLAPMAGIIQPNRQRPEVEFKNSIYNTKSAAKSRISEEEPYKDNKKISNLQEMHRNVSNMTGFEQVQRELYGGEKVKILTLKSTIEKRKA